ncbi:MAG: DUF58 domain-containing protein [Dehalococcoidia bacterium]|nr:DUF58 domain-containing protein [Dehalococcoidia bacterium]
MIALRRAGRRLAGLLPVRANPTATSGAQDDATQLLDRVRDIELKARKIVDELLLGEYHAVFRGLGIEFDELRPYVPGDEVRDIDWKTYARTREPFVRRYREDRDLTVMFVVDVSGSHRTGALAVSKADIAAELCAVLGLAAIRNNDRAGLLLFAGKPERFVRPARGARHVLRVIREVLNARPRTTGTDIAAALEYLTGIQRRRSTVFLVSDFLTSGYDRALRAAARRHDIIALRLRAPIDAALPPGGLARVRDAETGQEIDIDAGSLAFREAYAAHVRSLDDARARTFGELHIDEIPIVVGEDYIPALLRFFRRRARVAAS